MRLPKFICEVYLKGSNTRIVQPGRGGRVTFVLFSGACLLRQFCNETVESRDLVIGVVESNTLGQGSKPAELDTA